MMEETPDIPNPTLPPPPRPSRWGHERSAVVKLVVRRYSAEAQRRFQSSIDGSGCFVTSTGVILTCAHLFPDHPHFTVDVWQEHKSKGSATFLDLDRKTDIAILRLNQLNLTREMKGRCDFLLLGVSKDMEQGDKLFALGYPGCSLSSVLTSGVLGSNDFRIYRGPVYRTDAATNPGNSGCPIFYKKKVVGVCTDSVDLLVPQPEIPQYYEHRRVENQWKRKLRGPIPPHDSKQKEQNGTCYQSIDDVMAFLKYGSENRSNVSFAEACDEILGV